MKMKPMMLVGVAGACGIVAMIGAKQAMNQKANAGQSPKVNVLVAMTDIREGTRLDDTNVSFKMMPVDAVPEGAVTNKEEFLERSPTKFIYANDFITKNKLGEKGVYGATQEIPQGYRAVTLQVNDKQSHGGLLRPGDVVDVIVTYEVQILGTGFKQTKTKPLMEYIKVFAVNDQRSTDVVGDKADGKAKTVSLLVTPEQANYLSLAQKKGTLDLVMRSASDKAPTDVAVVEEGLIDELVGVVNKKDEKNGDRPRYETAKSGGEDDGPDSDQMKQPNVQDFLNAVNGKNGAPTTPTAAPSKPTWKITIYRGSERSDEQVELSEDQAKRFDKYISPQSGSTAAAEKPSGNSGKGIGNFLQGLMKQ